MAETIVIGAGVGGLAAAALLASRGMPVRILEMADRPGGKVGVHTEGGVGFDTGPSVLTLPEALEPVFRAAGTTLRDEIELLEPDPACRYLYPDGVSLDIHPDLDHTLQSVEAALGGQASHELEAFLAYGGRIWDAAAPHFVYGPAPGPGMLRRAGWRGLAHLLRIDPLRSMQTAIRKRVRSPHLRTLLARYATYNGSDPRRAPATLNCIAHVELALGGYGVRGGMHSLAIALARVATRAGARIEYGARVTRIRMEGHAVRGVELADGRRLPATAVIANADAAQVFGELLPRRRERASPDLSMSGWVAVLKARRREGADARPAHTVLFPRDYMREFADIFDHGRPPADPTVYLCAQERAHGRAGWPEHEPLFVMANAPPEPAGGARPEWVWEELRERVMRRLEDAGLRGPDDHVVFERTPADLARAHPGSRGALYGAASNHRLAAFRRPVNRVASPTGLYLASGSAHPGGGVPLCVQSGIEAARALVADGPLRP